VEFCQTQPFPPFLYTLLMCSVCARQSSSASGATPECNALVTGPSMMPRAHLIWSPDAPSGKTAPSFSIASCKTVRASSQRSRLFSLQIVQISIAANTGLLKIFVIKACFPAHSTILDSTDSLTLLPTLIFKAQWLHRFPLLQFPLQDSAQKKIPPKDCLSYQAIRPDMVCRYSMMSRVLN
jgi:hypothetical protein